MSVVQSILMRKEANEMKVLVIGAHGKVAKHFADAIQNHPTIEEKAVIRDKSQKGFFDVREIDSIVLDIVYDSIETLAEAMEDVDAVVFSAGAGGRGLDQTVMIDLDGAIKVMTAAEKAEVKRFVMVSTFRTGREEITKEVTKDAGLKIYTICKHYADEWLKNQTSLDWTIVHPGILTDEEPTSHIKVGMGNDINRISRQDVAQTILAVLENENTIHQEFEVLTGETLIGEAISSL